MTNDETWETPDEEGFERLLMEPLESHHGLLYRRSAVQGLDTMAGSGGVTSQKQREANHTHMILYAADIEVQREWALKLVRTWHAKVQANLPDLHLTTVIEDDGSEVIVTFWTTDQP